MLLATTRRSAVLLTAALLLVPLAPLVAWAQPAETTATHLGAATKTAAGKKVKPHAVVKVRTPKDVPANVVLTGKRKAVLVKEAVGRSTTWKKRLKPGRYRVSVPPVVFGGVRHTATVKPKSFKVPKAKKRRKYKAPKITVTLREMKTTTIIEASRITPSEVELRWLAPDGARLAVVRTHGDQPASQPADGTVVSRSGSRVTDREVAEGTTYTYALLLRSGKKWRLASHQLVGTPVAAAPSGSTEATPYAISAAAVVVDAADGDTASLIGGRLWVRLAGDRATPAVGAGFVLPPSTTLPEGFLGRVAEVSPDGRRVRLEQGGLPDVYSQLDIDVSLAGPTMALQPATGTAQARRLLARRAQAEGDGADEASPCGGEAGLTYTLHGPDFTPGGYFRQKIKSTWGVPHTLEYSMRQTMTVSASMDVEASGGVSCSIPFLEVNKTVPVPGIPLTLGVAIHPSLDISLTGTVTMENMGGTYTSGMWAKGSIGLRNSHDSGTVGEFRPNLPAIEFEAEASLSLSASFAVGVGGAADTPGDSAGAIAGVTGEVDIFKLAGRAVVADPTAGPCAVVEVTSRVKFGIGLRLWAGPFEYNVDTPLQFERTFDWAEPQYYPKGCEVVIGEGDVLVSLAWRSPADLDLHVVEPGGEEIWWSDPNSMTGGYLDTDANAACQERLLTPQENVTWPEGKSPSGDFRVWVHVWNTCQSAVDWTLVVKVDGRTVLSEAGTGDSRIYTITRDEEGPPRVSSAKAPPRKPLPEKE